MKRLSRVEVPNNSLIYAFSFGQVGKSSSCFLLRLVGIRNLFIFNRLICLSHLLKPASVCVTNIHYYPYAVKENQENLVFHKIKSLSISYDT